MCLLSVIKSGDPLRKYGIRVFEEKNLTLSPYSLVELSILRRSRKIEVENYDEFASSLSDLIASKEVRLIGDKPSYHRQAFLFEKRLHLTFFESLQVGVAKIEGRH